MNSNAAQSQHTMLIRGVRRSKIREEKANDNERRVGPQLGCGSGRELWLSGG